MFPQLDPVHCAGSTSLHHSCDICSQIGLVVLPTERVLHTFLAQVPRYDGVVAQAKGHGAERSRYQHPYDIRVEGFLRFRIP